MESEGSSPHSQQPAACPYHKPGMPPSYYLQNRLNISIPFMLISFKYSFSIRYPHQSSVGTYPLPNTCYIPHLFHFINWSSEQNLVRLQITSLLIMPSSTLSFYLVSLGPKYLPHNTIIEHSYSTISSQSPPPPHTHTSFIFLDLITH